jgi:hypothetical protein
MRTSLMRVIVVLFGMLLPCTVGCMGPVQQRDLVGSFQMKSSWACGRLSLNADHTFHQEVSRGCATNVITENGKWTVSLEGDNVETLSLTPFLSRGEKDEVQSFGFSDLAVTRLKWGPVRIVIDPDAGISYNKD